MVKILFFCILLVGLGICAYSLTLPYYTNTAAKEKLDEDSRDTNTFDQSFKDHYYSEVDKLKTNKTTLIDLGSGLSIFSTCILIVTSIFKIRSICDLYSLQTLNKTTIIVVSPIVWLLMYPGTYWYYIYRAGRGDYPWFADSIGIPIMETSTTILLGLFVLIIFLIITTYKSALPSFIFIKSNAYNNKYIFREVFWALILLLNLICLVLFIISGDHVSIPINLFFTYLILMLRAGQINASNLKLSPYTEKL